MVATPTNAGDGQAASARFRPEYLDQLFGRVRNEPIHFEPVPRDVLVQCPKCKTVETLQFVEGKLSRCRKFFEADGKVYHDCGSSQPCRLHK